MTMALVRRNPFKELETLQDEMNRLFNFSFSSEGDWSPAIDIYDAKDHITVKADLPGMTKDDIEVTIQNNHLILKGEKKHEEKKEEKDFIREERFYGSFYRVLPLAGTVDPNNVKAAYKNGVLELTLPKKEEAKPKQISIEVK